SFYHAATYTWSHLLSCPETKKCILIDPVLDYTASNGRIYTESSDEILDYIHENFYDLLMILETHAHADHITAAAYFKQKVSCKIAIGKEIVSVQKVFKNIFNLARDFDTNGSQFSLLLSDGDEIQFGKCTINAIHTPGHTNDSMSYKSGNNIFIGDTLLSPDYGTARCDFPGGDAEKLFDSIQKLYQFDDENKMYLCHDYPPKSRSAMAWFTVGNQKTNNIHIKGATNKKDFVALRRYRDKSLKQPKLIIPSIQINIAAGLLPPKEANGIAYLKIPLNVLGKPNSQ
ncbi:MBL-fold metallo-hydrolase superfamily, partial [hydrothermal vent metagenome]